MPNRGPEPNQGLAGLIYIGRSLSLNVVAGAVFSGWMVQIHLDASLPSVWLLILGLSVWAVYTADHLLDARKLGLKACMHRHRFHATHFQALLVLTIVTAATAFVLALACLGPTGVWFGIITGFATLSHLLLVRLAGRIVSPLVLKEFGVASIYVIGVWGLPVLDATRPVQWAFPIAFLLAALVNLIAFSFHERLADEQDNQGSIARSWGADLSKKVGIITGCLALLLLAAQVLFKGNDGLLATVLGVITSMQIVLLAFPEWFGRAERYRVVGDGAFILSAGYVFLRLVAGV